MIELINIQKHLDNNEIFEDLNLTIEKGKIYGLVGPNGVGKSTLLRLISGILDADKGSIMIDGKPLASDHRLKRDIIYVSDDPYFFGMNTLKELRQFYRIFYTTFNEKIYYHLLNNFQVNEKAKLSSFSKGMRRQVSLILGLALQPKVLLLDEAFDGLDSVMRMNLVNYLNTQAIEENLCVLIASHNIRELEEICDQLYLLYDKNIISLGSHAKPETDLLAYQLKFDKPVNLKEVESLTSIVAYELNENHLTLIIKKDKQSIEEIEELLKPVSYHKKTMTLEEIFIFTLKGSGYGNLI